MWYELHIENIDSNQLESLCEDLLETGALSVTLTDKHNQPLIEPAPGETVFWPEVLVNALYDDITLASLTQARLAAQLPHGSFHIEHLEDKPWERLSMDSFTPQQISADFWICPSWVTPAFPEAINLMLDPGLAFGTGTHPTTLLCLQWLSKTTLNHKRVLDYGCGSGILALAACKLGATSVQAVDIDDQALLATRNNAGLNPDLQTPLHVGLPQSATPAQDIVIANILFTPLLTLKETFHRLLVSGGTLVLSGLLTDQVAPLLAHYNDVFTHQHTDTLDGWARVELCLCKSYRKSETL